MEDIVKFIDGKPIKIPMADIAKYMQKLELTQDEAIALWLTDNDYMDNEGMKIKTVKYFRFKEEN